MRRSLSSLTLALHVVLGAPWLAAAEAPPRAASEPHDRFAPLAAPRLGADDRTQLDADAILVRDLPPSDTTGIGVLVMGLIDAAPDRVWTVMADCERQDEFLPRISHAAVRDRDGDSHTCDLVVDMPFPLEDARSATRHHVRRLPDGGYQRHWELAPGDWSFSRHSGSWSVHPYADGRRTLLVNRMDLLPKSGIPTWILRAAYTQQAPASFAAIREQVRALASESGKPRRASADRFTPATRPRTYSARRP
jgi:hypothetical protein